MENKLYHITYTKEILDTAKLASTIKNDEWIDTFTTIVTCSPDYSSITTQILNHKLSHLNNNELYEQLTLEMPYPNMSQVWDKETGEYVQYDRYLMSWVAKYINTSFKYLFVDSAVVRGRNFSKLKHYVKNRLAAENYKFGTLYKEKSSLFHPHYFVEEYDKDIKGQIAFEWENLNNPNWIYE